MQITVKPVGKTFQAVIREVERDLKKANRKVGTKVKKAGVAAINKGAPVMWGNPLKATAKIEPWPDGVVVTFFAAPRNAGGWAIQESGASAHDIYPRKGRQGRNNRAAALSFNGLYSNNVWHPGTRGRQAWTKAVDRLEPAVRKAVEEAFAEAVD